jgi:hypothetical protein
MVQSPMEARHGPLPRRLGKVTRIVPHLTFLLLCANAFPQNGTNLQLCEDFEQYRYIRSPESARADRPLRQDNINDEEVREVQNAALEVYPDSIVSISGVTDGCDCEDGDRCTAQVWLALNRANKTRSLVLSKIDEHWKIGAVQSWWIQYDAHQANFAGFGRGAKQLAWQHENQRLLDSFPACPAPTARWVSLRSNSHFSTCADMSSIQVSGSIRRASFKRIFPLQKQMPSSLNVKYSIDLVAFDCKDHREQVDQSATYFYDGRATKTPRTDPVLWNPIRPDTDSAADLDLICNWAGK